MLKTVVFWLLLQQPMGFYSQDIGQGASTSCPAATGLATTSKTASSICVAWDGSADQYMAWITRKSDGCLVATTYTPGKTLCFSGLSAGTYEVFVKAICGSESSDFIGIEDLIES